MRASVTTGLLVVVLGTAAAGTAVAVRAGEALPGTTVAGRDVGGLGRERVEQLLQDLEDPRTRGSLDVSAGDERLTVDRSLARVDVDGTADRALRAGRAGLVGAVLGPLLTPLLDRDGRDVPVDLDVDETALRDRVAGIAEQVDRPAFPGGLQVSGLDVTPAPPAPGRSVERGDAAAQLSAALRAGRAGAVVLPVRELAPPTTDADVTQVVSAARLALAGPYELRAGERTLVLSPAFLAPLLRTEVRDGRLGLTVDAPGLTEVVESRAARTTVAPVDARFEPAAPPPVFADKDDATWTPQPATLAVLPSRTGVAVDVALSVERLTALVLGGTPRSGELPLAELPPRLTTEQAQAAGVVSLIGTFTSSFAAGQPRATNIRRIAELVDGAYLAPGEVLSLNDTAGRRTRDRGFVADGAIVDGELVDEVGGGVSQFATTLFNAAFFAGLPIPEHQPHSYYISRYPAGRESTVYFGAIDVKVRNDTAHGITVQTSSTPGSVTVSLYGDNGGRQVSAAHGPRQPRDDGGFRIAVTRTVRGGDGVESTRVFRTSYDPAPAG